MAGGEDDDSKSEQASERKLAKARESGDVPISREAGHLLGYGALAALVAWYVPSRGLPAMEQLRDLMAAAPQAQVGEGAAGVADLLALLGGPLSVVTWVTFGALGLFVGAALLAGALQGPFVLSTERIRPKGSRLSPASGFGRLASVGNLVEFGKNLAKLLLIGAVGFFVLWERLGSLRLGAIAGPEWMPGLLGGDAKDLLVGVCLVMAPVAVLDIAWKRLSHMRKQRMTLKEVRDEHKDSEGDPFIKAKRSQVRRQRARQRIRQAVPLATLVITNPTHYAVALRYERGVDAAPVCVAKGTDRVAAQIRRLAHESEVPVIESRELARALHAVAEIDRAIPEAHWATVARLINYVYDLRRRIRRKPPEGATLRRPEDDRA